jgi:hypothetical protein
MQVSERVVLGQKAYILFYIRRQPLMLQQQQQQQQQQRKAAAPPAQAAPPKRALPDEALEPPAERSRLAAMLPARQPAVPTQPAPNGVALPRELVGSPAVTRCARCGLPPPARMHTRTPAPPPRGNDETHWALKTRDRCALIGA